VPRTAARRKRDRERQAAAKKVAEVTLRGARRAGTVATTGDQQVMLLLPGVLPGGVDDTLGPQ
jgi:hypothetical protein